MTHPPGSEVSYQCQCGRTLGISDKGDVCSRCGSSFITPLSLFPDTYFISDLCPFCGNPMSPLQEPIKCAHCSVIHHRTCWETNEGCTTWECPGSEDLQAGVLFSGRASEARSAAEVRKEPAPSAPELPPAPSGPASPFVPPLPTKKTAEESGAPSRASRKREEAILLKCHGCRKTIDKPTEMGGCPSCRTTYHLSCWIALASCKKCGYPEEWRKKRNISKPSTERFSASAVRSPRSAIGTAALRSTDAQTKTARLAAAKPTAAAAKKDLMIRIGIGAGVVFLILLVVLAGRSGGGGGASGPSGGDSSSKTMPTDFAGVERRINELMSQANALISQRKPEQAQAKANEAAAAAVRLGGLAGNNRDFQTRAVRMVDAVEDLKRRIALAIRNERNR